MIDINVDEMTSEQSRLLQAKMLQSVNRRELARENLEKDIKLLKETGLAQSFDRIRKDYSHEKLLGYTKITDNQLFECLVQRSIILFSVGRSHPNPSESRYTYQDFKFNSEKTLDISSIFKRIDGVYEIEDAHPNFVSISFCFSPGIVLNDSYLTRDAHTYYDEIGIGISGGKIYQVHKDDSADSMCGSGLLITETSEDQLSNLISQAIMNMKGWTSRKLKLNSVKKLVQPISWIKNLR